MNRSACWVTVRFPLVSANAFTAYSRIAAIDRPVADAPIHRQGRPSLSSAQLEPLDVGDVLVALAVDLEMRANRQPASRRACARS
jgi:hypothetical protein